MARQPVGRGQTLRLRCSFSEDPESVPTEEPRILSLPVYPRVISREVTYSGSTLVETLGDVSGGSWRVPKPEGEYYTFLTTKD